MFSKIIVKFEFYNEKRIPQTNSEVTAITQLMAESVLLLHYLFSRFSISSATNVFISKNRRRAEIWRSVFPLSTLVNVVRTSKHVTVIFIWYLFSWWKHQAYVSVQHMSCTGGWFRDKSLGQHFQFKWRLRDETIQGTSRIFDTETQVS